MNSYATTTQLVRGNALSDSASVVAIMYLQLGRFSGTEAVNNLVPIRRSGTTHPYVQKKSDLPTPTVFGRHAKTMINANIHNCAMTPIHGATAARNVVSSSTLRS